MTWIEAKMVVSPTRSHTAARRAIEKADLHQVRFDYLLDRIFLFVQGSSDRAKTDRTAVEFLNYRQQELTVHFIEAVGIDFHSIESIVGDRLGDMAFVIDLGKIAHATK